jgi:hypothetical protein
LIGALGSASELKLIEFHTVKNRRSLLRGFSICEDYPTHSLGVVLTLLLDWIVFCAVNINEKSLSKTVGARIRV